MDWKHTFLFLVVAIPSVAILTRVIAWVCRKKKKPQAEPEQELLEAPAAKPYATYEEYKKDLRGTVDLDVFLARCRAGVPENPEKDPEKANLEMASARERLARIQDRLRGQLDKTPVSSLPNGAVPVTSGGVGGDGSDGVLITGMGSPPPAQDQPKLQIHRENSCPACSGAGKTSWGGHTYCCYMCNRVVVPNTPR